METSPTGFDGPSSTLRFKPWLCLCFGVALFPNMAIFAGLLLWWVGEYFPPYIMFICVSYVLCLTFWMIFVSGLFYEFGFRGCWVLFSLPFLFCPIIYFWFWLMCLGV